MDASKARSVSDNANGLGYTQMDFHKEVRRINKQIEQFATEGHYELWTIIDQENMMRDLEEYYEELGYHADRLYKDSFRATPPLINQSQLKLSWK